jgi:hypothetical protein
MDNTRKKQLLRPIIFLIFSLVLYGVTTLYGKQTNTEEIATQPKQAQPVEKEAAISSIQISSPLDSIPSPFALLSPTITNPNTGPTNSVNPMMSPPTNANLPIFTSGSGFSSGANFSNATAPGRDVVLKAILYRPGDVNMAILDDGTNEVIATEGKTTEWGYISEITQHTVTIDGLVLTLNISEANTASKKTSNVGATPFLKPPRMLNH